MSSSYITISYHIILYLMFFYFISSADLISIPFYSILFYFISNRFDLIVFYLIAMNDLCLSVRPSVWLFICMNKFFSFLFFFSHERLLHTHNHTHIHTDTDTQIHMNICSFLWLLHVSTKVGKWRILFDWLYYLIFDLIR